VLWPDCRGCIWFFFRIFFALFFEIFFISVATAYATSNFYLGVRLPSIVVREILHAVANGTVWWKKRTDRCAADAGSRKLGSLSGYMTRDRNRTSLFFITAINFFPSEKISVFLPGRLLRAGLVVRSRSSAWSLSVILFTGRRRRRFLRLLLFSRTERVIRPWTASPQRGLDLRCTIVRSRNDNNDNTRRFAHKMFTATAAAAHVARG
jgi:hypothetical protein